MIIVRGDRNKWIIRKLRKISAAWLRVELFDGYRITIRLEKEA